MKVFAFTVENIDPKKDMCHNDRQARVYRIKNNIPKLLGFASYTFGRSKGHESEVMNALINWGELPKKLYNVSECDWRGPGFYCPEIEDMGYKIVRME